MMGTFFELLPVLTCLLLVYGFHLLVKYTNKLAEENKELMDTLQSMDKTICSVQAKCWNLEKRLRVFEDIVRSHQK